jgi:hypothetical protein
MNRKTLIGTFALVASLSAPLAFAQSQTDASSTSTDASAQSTTAADASTQSTTPTDASAQSTTTSNDASAATTQGDPAKKSWADVDADKDGNLSKAEASAVPALGQVFDQADVNADGSLTADEYKAYVKTQEKK